MPDQILPGDIDCGYDGEEFEDVYYEAIKAQTDLAVLFVFSSKEVWIPKSCIESVDDERVFVATWCAKKESLF